MSRDEHSWRWFLASGLSFFLETHAAEAKDTYYCWVDSDETVNCTDSRPAPNPERQLQVVRYGGSMFFPTDTEGYDAIFRAAADRYELPFAYLKAVAKIESNFTPDAVSRAEAKGIMQLIDTTAQLMRVQDPFDPRESIFAGARYLRTLADRFGGDLALTAAAYNAGPERVKRANGIPAIRETQSYVRRVLATYKAYESKPKGERFR